MTRVVVLSTSLTSPNASICKASVESQEGVEVEHRCLDAADQHPRKTKIENLIDMTSNITPETILAFVDGDDWLAHKGALARAVAEHQAGAWVTYGSFVQSDGKPGFAREYATTEYRKVPWLGTHLKTIRAGLFRRIHPIDLKFNGAWIDRADDPSFMWPCMEMAGPERVKFIRDVLYVYSYESCWERTASPEERAHERAIAAYIRSLPPYDRLESL